MLFRSAYLENSALERGNPATDECRQQVVVRHPLSVMLRNDPVDGVDFRHLVLRVVRPVMLHSGGIKDECRQIDPVDVG